MQFRLLQWNCRSFFPAKAELLRVLDIEKPHIVALQETWLQDDDEVRLPNYEIYRCDRELGRRGGGVLTAVLNGVPSQIVNTRPFPEIEYVGVDVQVDDRKFRIINAYVPAGKLTCEYLKYTLSMLDGEYLLMGDFNAHHPNWDKAQPNKAGRLIVQTLTTRTGIQLLNTGEATYLPLTHNSAPDLTLVPDSLCSVTKWLPHLDLGSDHIAIKIAIRLQTTGDDNILSPRPRRFVRIEELEKLKYAVYDHQQSTEDLWSAFKGEFERASTTKDIQHGQRRIKTIKSNWWWTPECYAAKIKRRAALHMLKKSPSPQNLLHYKKCAAQARRVIRLARRTAWHTYCTQLTMRTQPRQFWATIKTLNGKKRFSRALPPLQTDQGNIVSNEKEKLDLLADDLFPNDPDNRRNDIPSQLERPKRDANFLLECNRPFTMEELQEALAKVNQRSAPGPDQMKNSFLTRIPNGMKELLLAIINSSWSTASIPEEWRKSDIIPIHKPGTTGNRPSHYRPIALLNVVPKLIQAMINRRLMAVMEQWGLWSPIQCGGRKGHSTRDLLIRLTADIDYAKQKKWTAIVVCLDIMKAFDSIRPRVVENTLTELGIAGNLYYWICSFCDRRSIRIVAKDKCSRQREITIGIPQGSPLSGTIFNLVVNDLYRVTNQTETGQFFDDIAQWKIQREYLICKAQTELDIVKIGKWAQQKGLKLNPQKTQVLVITSSREVQQQPIDILGTPVLPTPTIKYLGVTLSKTNSPSPHIRTQLAKGAKAAAVLNYLGKGTWGTDPRDKMSIYKMIILPTLLYGLETWRTIPKTQLALIQRMQNKVLRQVFSLPKDVRVSDLHFLADILPIPEKITLTVAATALSTQQKHQYCTRVEHHKEATEQLIRELQIPTVTTQLALESQGSRLRSNLTQKIAEVVFDCTNCTEASVPRVFAHWIQQFLEYDQIYTDGSITSTGGAACMYHPQSRITRARRVKKWHNSTDTEVIALAMALEFIYERKINKTLILTDSMAACKIVTMNYYDERNSTHQLIQHYVYLCKVQNLTITITWIPGHRGIAGNEIADKVAKEATNRQDLRELPIFAYKSAIKEVCRTLKLKTRDDWWATTPQNGIRALITTADQCDQFWQMFKQASGLFLTWLTRVFCDKIRHNVNKFKWQQTRSPQCPRCTNPPQLDTLEHWLLRCPATELLRVTARAAAQTSRVDWEMSTVVFSPEVMYELYRHIPKRL